MIIGIDGYEANVVCRVGIGQYAYETMRSMYEILRRRSSTNVSVIVFLPGKPLSDMPKETGWWQYRVGGTVEPLDVFRFTQSAETRTVCR